MESDEDYDSKSVTAMGILETIENIVSELDGSPEVCFCFYLNLSHSYELFFTLLVKRKKHNFIIFHGLMCIDFS